MLDDNSLVKRINVIVRLEGKKEVEAAAHRR